MEKLDTITRAKDLTNTCILTVYKRPEYLREQVEAVLNQTFPPTEVWFVFNSRSEFNNYIDHEDGDLWYDIVDRITEVTGKEPVCIDFNPNKKYHARFAVGLLTNSYYVSFFDDDSVCGARWFENCYNCEQQQPGIYGSAGVILDSPQYVHHRRAGWPSRNKEIQRVDLVGHAWFMKRAYLPSMWIDPVFTFENGEDIQLSFQAQKYAKVNTFVPPHPEDCKEMWGSTKGWEYGNDEKASSNGSLKDIPQFYMERDHCIMYGLQNGWKTVNGIEKMFGG